MKRIIIDRKDKEQTTKNINEIEIFKQLNNDNLIKYFNSFIHKDKLCIVMEYADDGDLHSKIEKHLNEKKLIPEKTIWNWFLQLCNGLYYLHTFAYSFQLLVYLDLSLLHSLNFILYQNM